MMNHPILDEFAYKLYVTGLLNDENVHIVEAFLEQLDFSDHDNFTFDIFRSQFLLFKAAYINNELPF
ncbi:hypothetical protein [Bacillus massiliigorillae]|uniref:hypothetical protein n=1 Tax=Bacillus massiliigorillae TaxID=1243664 RepID=UPI0003A7A04D|nr:hypothetical protein [Bacillus massiliigorillae]